MNRRDFLLSTTALAAAAVLPATDAAAGVEIGEPVVTVLSGAKPGRHYTISVVSDTAFRFEMFDGGVPMKRTTMIVKNGWQSATFILPPRRQHDPFEWSDA